MSQWVIDSRRGCFIVVAMDMTFINDLHLETVIGVYDWERKIRQTVRLDVEMACDIAEAASNDDISKALDYQAISDRLVEIAGENECQLLETLVEKLASVIMKEYQVPWVRLRINKPAAVKGASGVGVQIERGSRS
ncbi:MAG: dihydroneopterin aldolase [Gammaproteobacteria bacterium]